MLIIVPDFQQKHEVFKGTALCVSIPYLPIKFLSEYSFKHPTHVTVQRLLFVITEWFGLKDSKDHLIQPLSHGRYIVDIGIYRYIPRPGIQSTIHPALEQFQG